MTGGIRRDTPRDVVVSARGGCPEERRDRMRSGRGAVHIVHVVRSDGEGREHVLRSGGMRESALAAWTGEWFF